MKYFFTFFFLSMGGLLFGQTTIDFEDFIIAEDSFLNGSDLSGGFATNGVFLPNSFDTTFSSWSGWSISRTTDTTTPGFMNQYSAITGSGFSGSANYAVSFGSQNIIELDTAASPSPKVVDGAYITNSTYAYLSMRDGDSFAKQFGGASGDDPDFFLLSIKGYANGDPVAESVDFYLADYRFADSTEDFIVDEWTFVDLSSLGAIDSLGFSFTSTDTGMFGINTPLYFCLDNLQISAPTSTETSSNHRLVLKAYPNPFVDRISLDFNSPSPAEIRVYDLKGNHILYQEGVSSGEQLDLRNLSPGNYVLQVRGKNFKASRLIQKY